MLKRPKAPSKTARKRRKGGTTYAASSLDPPDDRAVVEAIDVWDISTSGRTGRVSVRRRKVEHHHTTLEQPEKPPTSENPGGSHEGDFEDAGTLADSESRPRVPKNRMKKKRVRITKENDSMSELLVLRVVDP